jgi:hypothetical protein
MSSNDVETGGTPLLGPAATEKQEHWSRAWSRKAYASLSNCSLGLVFGLLTACALQVRFLSATCMCNMCCNGCVSVHFCLPVCLCCMLCFQTQASAVCFCAYTAYCAVICWVCLLFVSCMLCLSCGVHFMDGLPSVIYTTSILASHLLCTHIYNSYLPTWAVDASSSATQKWQGT